MYAYYVENAKCCFSLNHFISLSVVPLHGNFELRLLGVATGNALSVTRVWRYICKNTTCWPATAHDVTTGVPQYKCRRENTSSAFSSSLTGLFEACNLVRVQFSLYQMASTSKAFKIVCGSASSLFETRWHTQSLRLLFGQGARTRCPWGEICVHCELFLCKSSALVLSLFSRKEGQRSASRDSGPTAAEARRQIKLAVGCGRWVREGPPLFARVGREREWAAGLWRCDLSDIIRFSG